MYDKTRILDMLQDIEDVLLLVIERTTDVKKMM
jgi:hypothetical protein